MDSYGRLAVPTGEQNIEGCGTCRRNPCSCNPKPRCAPKPNYCDFVRTSILPKCPPKCRYPWIPLFILELLGTLFLTFIGSGSAAAGFSPTGVAIAHGYALFVVASAIGVYTGAHVNPGVTLAALILRQITVMQALVYWAAQYVGGIAAGALLYAFFNGGSLGAPAIGAAFSTIQGLFVEFVLTAFFVLFVLHIAFAKTSSTTPELAIGLTLGAIDLAVGTVTGGALNSARALGPHIFDGFPTGWWIYHVGPFAGAILAAVIFLVFDRLKYLKHKDN